MTILGDNDVYMLINGDGNFEVIHLDDNHDVDDAMASNSDSVFHGDVISKNGFPVSITPYTMFHGITISCDFDANGKTYRLTDKREALSASL